MKWCEPWFSAYGAVGLLVLGVAPILIPLSVHQSSGGSATQVALVVAAFYFGGLFAPVLGSLADTRGVQRTVFVVSFPLMGMAVLAYAFSDTTWQWMLAACIFGGLGSLSGTLASLFIVEVRPEAEWNSRLSWFRLSYGAGQVLGLVIAAVTTTALLSGWISTAAVLFLATALALWRLPHLKRAPLGPPATSASARVHHIHFPLGVHHYVAQAKRRTRARASKLYSLFIVAWLCIMAGIQTFFNVVPLVMQDAFHVSASLSSLLFLGGAAIGTALYPVAGRIANVLGAGNVLLVGLGLTAVAFGIMAVSVWMDVGQKSLLGSFGLILAAAAYSFEVAAATMMFVRLAPSSEGAAVGLLNGLIAGGAVIGALVPAALAQAFGYSVFPALALGMVVLGGLIATPLYARKHWEATPETDTHPEHQSSAQPPT